MRRSDGFGWVAGLATTGLVGALLVAPVPGYRWQLPAGFPEPKVPAENPMSDAKVELGRHLFYDPRLSKDGSFSCSTCHQQDRAFTEAKATSVGVTGEVHPRNAMGLTNIAYAPVLTWANPAMRQLEPQALVPMFGETPVEMGLAGLDSTVVRRLRADRRYQLLFRAAFPGRGDPVTIANVTRAIASFERTLISGDSPFDRARAGDEAAMSAKAREGEELFFSENLECFHCHGGFNFTGSVDYVGKGLPEIEFHNTGLYNIDGAGGYPVPNTGVHEITGHAEDMGRFKAPTLRNVAVTGPFMHDGSIATLEEVVDHYAAGGRTVAAGPHQGIGSRNPYKSPFVGGFDLEPGEKEAIVAFLQSLTDSTFLTSPAHANPWPQPFDSARWGAKRRQ
ncbi:MAG: di-heme enzyme [Gemmatimonadales bacterium]